jgi:hypothetical protein
VPPAEFDRTSGSAARAAVRRKWVLLARIDEEFEPDNFPQVNHNTSMCVMQFGFSPYRKPFDAPEAHR